MTSAGQSYGAKGGEIGSTARTHAHSAGCGAGGIVKDSHAAKEQSRSAGETPANVSVSQHVGAKGQKK